MGDKSFEGIFDNLSERMRADRAPEEGTKPNLNELLAKQPRMGEPVVVNRSGIRAILARLQRAIPQNLDQAQRGLGGLSQPGTQLYQIEVLEQGQVFREIGETTGQYQLWQCNRTVGPPEYWIVSVLTGGTKFRTTTVIVETHTDKDTILASWSRNRYDVRPISGKFGG